MLSKLYESTEVDRRTWLHMPSGTHWSTSSDTHQVVEIQKETSSKMYTPFLIKVLYLYCIVQKNPNINGEKIMIRKWKHFYSIKACFLG